MNFRELLSKVTPGKWVSICGPAHDYNGTRLVTANVCTDWTRGDKPERGYHNDPAKVDNVEIAQCSTYQKDVPVEELHANAQYIARLNPETMWLVMEALEETEFEYTRGVMTLATARKRHAAIKALNGESP